MFAPGVGELVRDFNVTNIELSSFVVSVYLLGYCFGPLLIAPLSELYGRQYVYHICNVFYVIWTIACGFAPEMGSLVVFRFLAGFAGSCPLTIGAGSIADMFVQEQRGGAMAAWALGPLVGPVAGPVGMSTYLLSSYDQFLTLSSWCVSGTGKGLAMELLCASYGCM
jgi:MFS family permease